MVVRHGHVVAEGWWRPYAAERVHLAYSLSKTVTATAVGFLVQEGTPVGRRPGARPLSRHRPCGCRRRLGRRAHQALPLDDGRSRGGRLGPRLRPQQRQRQHRRGRLGAACLRDAADPGPGLASSSTTRSRPTCSSLIVGRVAGTGLAEMLRPRLLEPLGLPDIPWHRDPLGRELGFTGSHLTTEAIASIAQLYLDRGRWEGRQVLVAGLRRRGHSCLRPAQRRPERRRGLGAAATATRSGCNASATAATAPTASSSSCCPSTTRRRDHRRAGRHAVDPRRAVGPRRPGPGGSGVRVAAPNGPAAEPSWPHVSRRSRSRRWRRRARARPRGVHPLRRVRPRVRLHRRVGDPRRAPTTCSA